MRQIINKNVFQTSSRPLAVHCVLVVRSFGSRPDLSSITLVAFWPRLRFAQYWSLHSPLWVSWGKKISWPLGPGFFCSLFFPAVLDCLLCCRLLVLCCLSHDLPALLHCQQGCPSAMHSCSLWRVSLPFPPEGSTQPSVQPPGQETLSLPPQQLTTAPG